MRGPSGQNPPSGKLYVTKPVFMRRFGLLWQFSASFSLFALSFCFCQLKNATITALSDLSFKLSILIVTGNLFATNSMNQEVKYASQSTMILVESLPVQETLADIAYQRRKSALSNLRIPSSSSYTGFLSSKWLHERDSLIK